MCHGHPTTPIPPHPPTPHRNGTDGAGKPWVCLTGKKQSPINIPGPNRFSECAGAAVWGIWWLVA